MNIEERVTNTQMQTVLHEIYDRRIRTYRLIDYEGPTRPGTPATETQILEVEKAFGITFPHSYRLFLSIHNGWQHWSGDVALLSTEQMLIGKYADRIKEWKTRNGAIDPILRSALVIGFSLFNGEQIFVDTLTPNLPVIVWDHGQIEQHADFFDYLLSFRATLEDELASDLG